MQLEFIWVLILFLFNLILTLPSVLYHGSRNIYFKWRPSRLVLPTGKLPSLIVMIHGRNGHYTNFDPLIQSITRKGLEYDICTIDLGANGSTTIEQEVEIVRLQLRPYFSTVNNIVLLGVSKGGCTAVAYGIKYPAKIKRIITVSSPLNGTKVANYHLLCDVTRNELGYKSLMTSSFQQPIYGPEICSIIPTHDHIIIPSTSACLPNTTSYVYPGYYSHAGILYALAVHNKIAEWLNY